MTSDKINEPGTQSGREEGRKPAAGETDPANIRAEIQKTRTNMSGTVNAIEEKLSPARIKEQVLEQFEDVREKVKHEVKEDFVQVKERVRSEIQEAKHAVHDATVGRVEDMFHSASETITESSSSVVDAIRGNPVPALLAGVGLTWLFMNVRGQRNRIPRMSRGYGEPMSTHRRAYAARSGHAAEDGLMEHGRHVVGDAAHRAGDAAGEVAHRVRDAAGRVMDQAGTFVSEAGDKVGAAVHDVGDKASSLALSAQSRGANFARDAGQGALRFEHRVEEGLRENPLAFGAALLAAGATVGLMLPHTRREDELMGEARDRLIGSAQHLAHETVDELREKAEGAIKDVGGASSPKRSSQPRA
ncbi:MAG: DUF3618 domain-containing protein [Myxococcota bacterium]|nr:DUF3618 domain-containing protein [Myxococcota bacterium]